MSNQDQLSLTQQEVILETILEKIHNFYENTDDKVPSKIWNILEDFIKLGEACDELQEFLILNEQNIQVSHYDFQAKIINPSDTIAEAILELRELFRGIFPNI